MALLAVLYGYGLTRSGVIGPDEPRYAAIGLEMAHSGDWVTPRLWGQPWFEKPPLVYWMTAVATKAGLGPELAPRLPVALIGWGFLVFFYWILSREFGPTEALYATAVLGVSAGWIAYSFVSVTDVPMGATFCAALLLSLRYVGQAPGPPRPVDYRALAIGILLGLSTLAKGLVPLVLFAPLLWPLRKHVRALLWISAACLIVAAPWYILCTARNGSSFLIDLIWRHHVERFTSDVLQHVRPWWFYVPVLLAGVFPWTPLIVFIRPRLLSDARLRFLALWTLLAFIFFAAARNKLPGYMIPLLPPLAALLGIGFAWARKTRIPLLCSALLVALAPVVVAVLPQALNSGLSRSRMQIDSWFWAAPFVLIAIGCLYLEIRGWRTEALLLATASMTLGTFYLKTQSLPVIDQRVSVRHFYQQHANWLDGVCLEDVHRDAAYGLAYYAGHSFPTCPKDYQGSKIMGLNKTLILLD